MYADAPASCVTKVISRNKLTTYRKISNIRRTKSQNLNESRPVWQLFLPNPLNPGVKSKMKM